MIHITLITWKSKMVEYLILASHELIFLFWHVQSCRGQGLITSFQLCAVCLPYLSWLQESTVLCPIAKSPWLNCCAVNNLDPKSVKFKSNSKSAFGKEGRSKAQCQLLGGQNWEPSQSWENDEWGEGTQRTLGWKEFIAKINLLARRLKDFFTI